MLTCYALCNGVAPYVNEAVERRAKEGEGKPRAKL